MNRRIKKMDSRNMFVTLKNEAIIIKKVFGNEVAE